MVWIAIEPFGEIMDGVENPAAREFPSARFLNLHREPNPVEDAGMKRVWLWILVCAFGLVGVTCGAGEVDLQSRPARLPADTPRLSNLRDAKKGEAVTTDEWLEERARLKREWQGILGEFPKTKAPLEAKIESTEQLDGFSRSLVTYQAEEGVFTDGYLLKPGSPKKQASAVVVFHPTTPLQAKGVAGVDPSYDEEKRQGVQLVKRGFIVFCPRNYINSKGADAGGNAKKVLAAHPHWTGMTRMTWDAVRAVDYLESLPDVDRDRIGC